MRIKRMTDCGRGVKRPIEEKYEILNIRRRQTRFEIHWEGLSVSG